MGYSIYIGNAVISHDEEDLSAHYTVEHVEHANAPEWPDPVGPDGKPDFMLGVDISGKTNGRHPSYMSFAEWARRVDLYELFLGVDEHEGLLNPHPGCHRLTPEIVAEVCAARAKWEASHPGAMPGWREGEDPDLAKLIWYGWWMTWAMANCKIPAISNS